MNNELIDELYDLINSNEDNLLEKYKDKFQEFYDDRYTMLYDITLNSKVYTILEYMIKNSKGIFFEYEVGELVYLFNNNLNSKFQVAAYHKDTVIDNDFINKLFELVEHYNILRGIVSDNEYYERLDEYDKGFVDDLLKPYHIRDISSAFIILLHNGYFNLDEEVIDKLLLFIRNNDYVEQLFDKNLTDLDKNYIYQYLNKYVFIKDFSTTEELSNDKLINSIIKGKINNIKIYKYLFDNINISVILKMYNNNLKELFDDIDKNYSNKMNIYFIKDDISRKLLKDGYANYLIDYYLETKDEFMRDFIHSNNDEIMYNINNIDVQYLTVRTIKYCLKFNSSNIFKLNIYNYYKDKELPEELKKDLEVSFNYYSKCRKYTIEELVDVLKKVFINNESLSLIEVVNICDTMFTMITGDDKSVKYMCSKKGTRGQYCNNEISVDLDYYNKFSEYDPKENTILLFNLLITLFHESTHYKQDNNDIETEEDKYFLKERIIRLAYPNYYENNYGLISYEKDARVKAYELCYAFLRNYIPEVLDIFIELYSDSYRKDIEMDIQSKTLFDKNLKLDIDRIFERLVHFHPEVIEGYPILFDENKSKT